MKFTEIKDLTSEELRKKQSQLRDELFEAKMKHSLGQVGNPIEIRDRRRAIARVMTAINLKLGGGTVTAAAPKAAAPAAAPKKKVAAKKTAKRKE